YWRKHWQSDSAKGFDRNWQTAVHDGVVAGTRFPFKDISLTQGWQRYLQTTAGQPEKDGSAAGYEILFQPDPTIYDGRFANNGWLQELPKPITTLTWENAAIMSPQTAKEVGVAIGSYTHGGEHGGYHVDVVDLQLGDAKVRAPVWIMPGHADGSI